MSVIHSGQPNDPILMVSYFKLDQKCVYKPCAEPITEVRATLTASGMLVVATLCSRHVASERESLRDVADEIKADEDPKRN